MPSRRQRRVNGLLSEELSELLRRKVKDPRLEGLTVVAVETSPDLKRAHVYISSLGSQEERQEALRGLQGAGGFLRRELAVRLSLRCIPEIFFHLDDSLERGQRIADLLQRLEGE